MMDFDERGLFRFCQYTLVSVFVVALVGCDSKDETLIRVPTEKEANEIIVVLNEHDIEARKQAAKGGQRKTVWEINLPPEARLDIANARKILYYQNLPRDPHGGFEEMIGAAGMIPTKSDERARLMAAQAGELQRTFETIDRIVSARVHVNIPEHTRIGGNDSQEPSAAVVLKYLPGEESDIVCPADPTATDSGAGDEAADPPSETPERGDWPICPGSVKEIVSNSIEGLKPGSVAVHFSRAPAWKPAPMPAPNDGDGTDATSLLDDPRFKWTVGTMGGVIIVLLCLLLWGKGRQEDPSGSASAIASGGSD